MSKLYKQFLELKCNNPDNYYIFEVGVFYLFLGSDAEKISKIIPLKLTHFNEEVMKCGFPTNSIEKYKKILDEKNIIYEIITKREDKQHDLAFYLGIVDVIRNTDIDKITPIEAMNVLKGLRDML